MNRAQMVVVSIGAAVILLMLLFPPFQIQIWSNTSNLGYGFILDPPKQGMLRASVNSETLLIQWAGTLLITALTFFLLKSPKESPSRSVADRHQPISEPIATKLGLPAKEEPRPLDSGQYHPWRRFFARTVDLLTIGLLLTYVVGSSIGYLLGTYLPDGNENIVKLVINPIVWTFIPFLVWIPVEAAFLAVSGATPAKWLFGIRIASSDNSFLSFGKALERSLLVWIQGLAFAIPVVTLITQYCAYRRLTSTGVTLWDDSVGAVVTHKQWGPGRTTCCIAAVFVAFVILGVSSHRLTPLVAPASSTLFFEVTRLPRGIELEIPKGWWVLGSDYVELIDTSVEGIQDLSGLEVIDGAKVNLIAANARPFTTYASIRIDSVRPPSLNLDAVAAATTKDLKEFENQIVNDLTLTLPLQGNHFLEVVDYRKEKLSGHPALVIEYRRSGPKGPVFVQVNQIFTPSQEVVMSLSFRESEAGLWRPVIAKIRTSVRIAE